MKNLKDLFGVSLEESKRLNKIEKRKQELSKIPENALKINYKEKKITVSWFVGRASNLESLLEYDHIDDIESYLNLIEEDEFCFINDDLLFDTFENGLIMHSLVKAIETKLPQEFSRYFHDSKSIEEYNHFCSWEGEKNIRRLIIYQNRQDTDASEKEKHMNNFYRLWKSYKFGKWKFTSVGGIFDHPPVQINFEWSLPDFLDFDVLESPTSSENDLFYLATEMESPGNISIFSPHFFEFTSTD